MIRRFALRFVDTYQREVSHRLGVRCPQVPSCSEYGRWAFSSHGSLRAAWLTWRRVRGCGSGTLGVRDP